MRILNFVKQILNFEKKRKPLNTKVSSIFLVIIKNVWYFLWRYFFYQIILFPVAFATMFVYSGSMTPTTSTNSLCVVSSLNYGIRIPFSNKKIFHYNKPQLGDVVLLNSPVFKGDPLIKRKYLDNKFHKSTLDSIYSNLSFFESGIYGKRIVACPGDKIQFINNLLFLNDKPLDLINKGSYKFIDNEKEQSGIIYEEIFPNGVKHKILHLKPLENSTDSCTEPFIIPENYYFTVGDNRQDSDDSRSLLGIVHENHILAKIVFVLLSNGNMRTMNPKKFIAGIKLDECLKFV